MSEQFRQELAGRWYPSSAARAVAQRYVRDLPPSVDRSDVAAIVACAIDDARQPIDVAAARAAAFEEAAALAMSVEPLAPDRRYLNPDDFYVDRGALAEKIAEYKADFGAEMARVFRALAAKERQP